MFNSKRKNLLKITSGATLFAVAPTLALQAQGIDAVSKTDQFLEESYKSTGLDIKTTSALRYVSYTAILAVSVFLLYCLACFADKKLALKVLQKKYNSKLLAVPSEKSEESEESDKRWVLMNKITAIKDDFDNLKIRVQEMKEKISAKKEVAGAEYTLNWRLSSSKEEIKNFVSSMKDVGIYDDFEKKYFKLDSVIDDTNYIETLRKTKDELSKEFDSKCEGAGDCSLRETDIIYATGSKGIGFVTANQEKFYSEKNRRLQVEKEKKSDIYKAYLRYEFVGSLLALLEMKKKVEDATAQLKKYEEVDLYKNLETIKNKILGYDLRTLNLAYSTLPFDFQKEIFGENYVDFSCFLYCLERVQNLDLEKVNNPGDKSVEKIIMDLGESFSEKNRNNFGQFLTNFKNSKDKELEKKFEDKKMELEKKFENKKMEIENASFFHIPGKNIIESCNFEF